MVKLIELIDLSEFYKCWVFFIGSRYFGGEDQIKVELLMFRLSWLKKTNHLKQVISYMAFPIFFTICNTSFSYRLLRQSLRNFMLRSCEIIEVLGDGNLRCPLNIKLVSKVWSKFSHLLASNKCPTRTVFSSC